jgi:hypothetical protein
MSLVNQRRLLRQRHWELVKGSHLWLKGSQIWAYRTRPGGIHGFQGEPPRTVRYNQQKLVNNYWGRWQLYPDLSWFQNNMILLARLFVLDGLLWSKSGIEHFAIGWNIRHWYAATYSINQDFTTAAGTELAMQGCGSHNHNNRRE